MNRFETARERLVGMALRERAAICNVDHARIAILSRYRRVLINGKRKLKSVAAVAPTLEVIEPAYI